MASVTFHGMIWKMIAAGGAPAPHALTPWLVTTAFIVPACAWILVVGRLGWRVAGLLAFFFCVLPVPVAALVGIITGDGVSLMRWILGGSGLFLPAFAWWSGFEFGATQLTKGFLAPCLVSLAIHAAFLIWLLRRPLALARRSAVATRGEARGV